MCRALFFAQQSVSSAWQAILAGDTEALNEISKEMQRRAKAIALNVTVT